MRKIRIVLSNLAHFDQYDRDTSYWVMADAASGDVIARIRMQGVDVTVFDKIDNCDEDALLNTIVMATLHNVDWCELQVIR